MALEYQRYGRNKDTVVNRSYIESGEYRNKFNNITDNIKVNRILYSKAKEMLYHRSGTLIEDMYWIDGDTGEIVARALSEQQESSVRYTEAIGKDISGKENLIALHTHPHSMPPSVADFNSALEHKYSKAFVICHNGRIIQYVSHQKISDVLYSRYVQRYIMSGCGEYEAQWNALKK